MGDRYSVARQSTTVASGDDIEEPLGFKDP